MNSKLLNAKTLDKHPTIRRLVWQNDEGRESSLVYRLKRHAFSRRITLRWTAEGAVVTAPVWATLKPIDNFVFEKRGWLAERAAASSAQALEGREFVPFRGRRASFRFNASETRFERTDEGEWVLFLHLPANAPKALLEAEIGAILRREARKVLGESFERVQRRVPLKAALWRLSSAKGRWGSCNPRLRSVNLSWRLVGCEDDLIDYVVAHELAHLREANHSKAFWAEVEKIDPLYREHERRLKMIRADMFPGL